jgi:hypothetical protein
MARHFATIQNKTANTRWIAGRGQACPIPEDQLDPVRPLGPEHTNRARERTWRKSTG